MDESAPLEIISADAINAIERGQSDVQIATAKKYPRSIQVFMDEAKSMISLNQDTAESCNYKLKRKGKDGIKVIEGPSIRLLEIAASAYGNLMFGSRIVGEDDNYVTAQGFAFDMQRNVRVAVEVKRAIRTSDGRRYSVDMIGVVSLAAGSIARRNALNGGAIPRVYINELSAHAKKIAVGDVKTLQERRQRAFDYFTQQLGVDMERVLAYLEKPSIADCGLPEVEELQGLKTMLKEGEAKIDEVFPDPNAPKTETPDLSGKPGQKTPDLGQKQEQSQPAGQSVSAPVQNPTPPTNVTPMPQTQAATEPAKPKRQRAPKPQEPAAQAPASPEASQAPAQAPAAPALTMEQKADALDGKLETEGVEVGDFFDWCKSAGRAAKFKFDPDKCQSIADAPEALIDALLAENSPDLAACVRVHGRAARERNKVK